MTFNGNIVNGVLGLGAVVGSTAKAEVKPSCINFIFMAMEIRAVFLLQLFYINS